MGVLGLREASPAARAESPPRGQCGGPSCAVPGTRAAWLQPSAVSKDRVWVAGLFKKDSTWSVDVSSGVLSNPVRPTWSIAGRTELTGHCLVAPARDRL